MGPNREWKLVMLFLWSYASHRAQSGVTNNHSTCCGCCVRDYHISFQLFALSSPFVTTQCLKDPQRGWGWHNSAGSSSDSQVIWVVRLSSKSKNRENPLLTNNKKWFLLKHVCEAINNKQRMFAFLAKRRKIIESGRVTMRCGYNDTNVSKVWHFEFL